MREIGAWTQWWGSRDLLGNCPITICHAAFCFSVRCVVLSAHSPDAHEENDDACDDEPELFARKSIELVEVDQAIED